MTFKNWIVNACVVIAAGTAVACGSSSPTAPNGLPGTQNSAAGATINGSVMRAGLTVAVVGTDVSAVADGVGNFTLRNVPAGDVQLKFSGAGTDASLTLNGVNGGEEIRLVVNVNGGNASVQNLTRGDRKVEIEGLVASGTCASFVVNGTTITTNATTVFQRGTCASVVAGAKVEVKGAVQADGSVLATHVKLDDDDNGEFEVEGTISAFTGCSSFTVNGIVITTNASTKFQHGTCSSVNTGVKVDVEGIRTGDVYLATRVEFEQKNANRVELEGRVTAGGCGSFTLRGVVVTTDATTQFKHGVCSGITTDVKLHVRGTRVGTGVLASLVTFQDVDDDDEEDDDDDDDDDDDEDEEDDDDGPDGGRGRR